MNPETSAGTAPRSDASGHAVDEASLALRDKLGEARGFETVLARMRGGVVYTLLCAVNSVFTLVIMLVAAMLVFDAVFPDDSSPVWAPVNAFALWAARTAAPMAKVAVPGTLDDVVDLINLPLFTAWFMVMLWVPYAVLCAVVALFGRLFGWRGPGRFPLLGRFAVAVNLPGRIWTGLIIRLLFGWVFRHKLGFLKIAGLTVAAAPIADPFPTKQYRWANQYGRGWKEKGAGFNPIFFVVIGTQLFLFVVTLVSWSMAAMPYLFPIIGMMVRSQTPLSNSTLTIWGVVVALVGLTLGVWVPSACDFYARYGAHLTVRQRFDWFPLMPRLADLVGRDVARRLKSAPTADSLPPEFLTQAPASDAGASAAASTESAPVSAERDFDSVSPQSAPAPTPSRSDATSAPVPPSTAPSPSQATPAHLPTPSRSQMPPVPLPPKPAPPAGGAPTGPRHPGWFKSN